jgi:hypothetical protein
MLKKVGAMQTSWRRSLCSSENRHNQKQVQNSSRVKRGITEERAGVYACWTQVRSVTSVNIEAYDRLLLPMFDS